MSFTVDVRVARGRLVNIRSVLRTFPVGEPAEPWNAGQPAHSDDEWIDRFIFQGFQQHGAAFLGALDGRFACCHYDRQRQSLFLARDWIGEAPMHVLATSDGVIVGNTLDSLHRHAGMEYVYAHVRAFPQASWQEIDLAEARTGQVDLTMRPAAPECFYDFRAAVTAAPPDAPPFAELRTALLAAIDSRRYPRGTTPMLLSGGLDSLSVALLLKEVGADVEAFTLSIGEPEPDGDPLRAVAYARKLGIRHHLVTVDPHNVASPSTVEEAIAVSESYHLYNVYCAVGMLLLARRVREHGLRHAFCGEGFNEAVGDYRDWVIKDPRNQRDVVLQRLNAKKLSDRQQRIALVWGPGRDHGRYNHQLGAGLAKHAGARMFKPFLAYDLALEAPLFDKKFMAHIVALDGTMLAERGGKPWLVAGMLGEDLNRVGIDLEEIRSAPKVRLQDAGTRGRGGISPLLYSAGYDQRRVLAMFNSVFSARLVPDVEVPRLMGRRAGA